MAKKVDTPVLNREQWLNRMADLLRPHFRANGHELPDNIRVSVGFPSHGATSIVKQVIGQCFYTEASDDKTFELFISPVIGEGTRAADVLVHELCHALLPVGTAHKGPFAKLAKSMGLEGKPTATVAGKALAQELQRLVKELGPYPHAALHPLIVVKKQAARQLKVECAECGYVARCSKKWLDVGPPLCPTHKTPMTPEGDSADDPDPAE